MISALLLTSSQIFEVYLHGIQSTPRVILKIANAQISLDNTVFKIFNGEIGLRIFDKTSGGVSNLIEVFSGVLDSFHNLKEKLWFSW
jgi:hypothetical protein